MVITNNKKEERVNVTVTTNAGHTDNYSNVIFTTNQNFVIIETAGGRTVYYPLSSVERVVVGK